MGGPTHHAALLFQEVALSIRLLGNAAYCHQKPDGQHDEECAPENLPWEKLRLGRPRLLYRNGGSRTARHLHLLRKAGLTWLEFLRRPDEVESVAERGWKKPLLWPPGKPRKVLRLRLLSGLREIVKPDCPRKLDTIADPGENVDDGLHATAGLDDAILKGHAQAADHRDERCDLFNWSVIGSALRLTADVHLQDAVVGSSEHDACRPGHPDSSQLTEGMALSVETTGLQPVGEEVEERDARVDVVGPPLLLEATVKVEVLRECCCTCSGSATVEF
mmetsp:Transcript_28761/g.62730  ORF Transcript_28761/g.62730 Transcript_28761/m.62730 type:complete len:276 (+) Transcript_28761:1008-1835(+)